MFSGEFGYELISWMPYLKYVKEKYNIDIKTCSSEGTSILYNFSSKHYEVNLPIHKDCWGYYRQYKLLQKKLDIDFKKMIFPCMDNIGREIIIGDSNWNIKDIHSEILLNHYSLLNYDNVAIELPFKTDKPIAVINNKSYSQLTGKVLIKNYYNPHELIVLKEFLVQKGFYVVYNHFKDKFLNSNEVKNDISDNGIFGNDGCSYDLNEYYHYCEKSDKTPEITRRNLIQISLYNKSQIVLCTQGGNAYLPSICKNNILLLMRDGNYIDYQELGRIYKIKLECFYEVQHMLSHMESTNQLNSDAGND